VRSSQAATRYHNRSGFCSEMKQQRKKGSGGARTGAGRPAKEKTYESKVRLTIEQKRAIVAKYGSLTEALKSLL
jgi:hypothetical protein